MTKLKTICKLLKYLNKEEVHLNHFCQSEIVRISGKSLAEFIGRRSNTNFWFSPAYSTRISYNCWSESPHNGDHYDTICGHFSLAPAHLEKLYDLIEGILVIQAKDQARKEILEHTRHKEDKKIIRYLAERVGYGR